MISFFSLSHVAKSSIQGLKTVPKNCSDYNGLYINESTLMKHTLKGDVCVCACVSAHYFFHLGILDVRPELRSVYIYDS